MLGWTQASPVDSSGRFAVRPRPIPLPLLPVLLVSLLAGGFALVAAGPATALQEAQAEVQATGAGDAGDSQLDTQTVTATANVQSIGQDLAEAEANATTLGALRSRSVASGASGPNGPSDADARAAWYSDLTTTDTDPGGPIDLDLDVTIDGTLTYFQNNVGPSADDIRSSVRLEVTLVSGSTVLNPFDGTTELTSVSGSVPPALNRSGSWADPARDPDFTVVSCSAFSCQVDVSTTVSIEDTISVGFGQPFSLEVQFRTDAFIWNGEETEATADFLNTANVVISTDTPDVTIAAAPDPPSPVPALSPTGLGALIGTVGGGGLLATAVRRRAARPSGARHAP